MRALADGTTYSTHLVQAVRVSTLMVSVSGLGIVEHALRSDVAVLTLCSNSYSPRVRTAPSSFRLISAGGD